MRIDLYGVQAAMVCERLANNKKSHPGPNSFSRIFIFWSFTQDFEFSEFFFRTAIAVSTLVAITSTGVLNRKKFFQAGPQRPEAFSILFNGIHRFVFPIH